MSICAGVILSRYLAEVFVFSDDPPVVWPIRPVASEVAMPVQLEQYILGNSLVNFSGGPYTNVPYWTDFFAEAAGNDYAVSGSSGFLRQFADQDSPQSGWGFEGVDPAWNAESEPFEQAGIDVITVTPANFVQDQAPDANYYGDDRSPLDAMLDIVGDMTTAHPEAQVMIYQGWADLAYFTEDLSGAEAVMEEYHASMMELGALLMRGLALSLHLDEHFFDDFCIEPMVGLRLLHYPPQPANAAPDEKGCGAHTDWGGLTMLMQDQNGGLQVLGKDGTWFNAPPRADAYVVNLGDMIARWTNDRYRSTMHRVVNISGTERYSVPFFYTGAPDHRVEVLPSCLADGEVAKYPVTTVEQHIAEMYAKTYG